MADEPVKKRSRKSARKAARKAARQRGGPPTAPGRSGPSGLRLPPPDWFDDPEGGAGVREPRRPRPTMPAGSMELEEPASPFTRQLVGLG